MYPWAVDNTHVLLTPISVALAVAAVHARLPWGPVDAMVVVPSVVNVPA